MHLLLSSLALLLAIPPLTPYAAIRTSAVLLDRPAQSIAAYVGACDVVDGGVSGECLENTKDLKERVVGKRVALDLGAGHESLLGFGGRNGAKTRFVWAPLYDVGNGLALTVGKPQKLSAAGNVVVAKRPIDGESPDTYTDLDLERLVKTGQVGIEIVGKFGKPWSLAGGTKPVRGTTFELEAIRLYHARTGATLFESTTPLR